MAQIGIDNQAARAFLEAGNVVGIPTETVYGLAGNALNPDAVLTIFNVKNRPSFDPLGNSRFSHSCDTESQSPTNARLVAFA